MGIFEGLIGGFGKAYAGHQKEAAARTAKQSELEQTILGTLLGSDNPEVQMRAMQAMMQGASGKGKKKGGVSGFLGETEPSPAFAGMFDYLKGLDKPQPGRAATPDVVTNTEEVGEGGVRIPTQTITAGDPAVPVGTPTTLFKTPEQRQLEARRQEREDIRGEPQPAGPRQTQVISTNRGQFLVDSQTGTVIQEYDPKAGGQAPAIRGAFMEDDRGQHLVDPTTGQIIATFGPKPEGAGVPRDRPGYLNAGAAKEQIESALAAKFSKLDLDMGQRSPKYQQIQAERDTLAVEFGFQSYDDVLRNAATRRGELEEPGGMGMPPGEGQGIQGQGEDVDRQRAAEIWQAWQAFRQGRGSPPSPEDQEFLTRYLEMYP